MNGKNFLQISGRLLALALFTAAVWGCADQSQDVLGPQGFGPIAMNSASLPKSLKSVFSMDRVLTSITRSGCFP